MFGGNAASPSLADIAAVTGNRNTTDDMFGGNNGWWILIILFAIFGGWGNGNNAGYGYPAAYGTDASLQRGFDTQSINSGIRSLENGLCSLGYDQLEQMNGINQNIMQTGYSIKDQIQQGTVTDLQNNFGLSRQLSEIGYAQREATAGVNYNLATDTCSINTSINQAVQAIMQNDNNNYRQLHDEIVQIQRDADKAKIAEQAEIIQSQNNRIANTELGQYIVQQIRPQVVPAVPANGLYTNGFFNCQNCGS